MRRRSGMRWCASYIRRCAGWKPCWNSASWGSPPTSERGKQGATVIGTATSDTGAQAISAYLDAAGIKGAGMALNVNDIAQTEQMLGELRKRFGEVTILVNNAGITRDNLLARMTDEEWDDVLGPNLRPVFRLSRAVLRAMMKARSRRIIILSPV